MSAVDETKEMGITIESQTFEINQISASLQERMDVVSLDRFFADVLILAKTVLEMQKIIIDRYKPIAQAEEVPQ